MSISLQGQKNSYEISGYYSRLPFNDHDFTGKYADIIIELPGKGKFIFSREFSYQPFWQPVTGKRFLVERVIPRSGDGPPERPDRNNICSNAAIVERTEKSVTVHWRYAPDINKLSFINFLEAYNKSGNPSEFYAEYADEYFTITSDGTVLREVRNGCYDLDEWNDPLNKFTQKLILGRHGISTKSQVNPLIQHADITQVQGAPIKEKSAADAVINFSFNEGTGRKTRELISEASLAVLGTKAFWRRGVSGTCLSFDSYSSSVILPSGSVPQMKNEFSIEAWIAPQEYPINLAAIVDHLNHNSGYFLGMTARGEIQFIAGNGSEIQILTTKQVDLYKWTHVVATFSNSNRLCIYLNGKLASSIPALGSFTDSDKAGLALGMTLHSKQYPLGSERDVTRAYLTNFVFSGLIDEVSVYERSLTEFQVNKLFESLKPEISEPLQPWNLPYGPDDIKGFGAVYANLKYSPEWDGIWRAGNVSDLVVSFDNKPWRYIFWRGTRYLPSLVTGKGRDGIWCNDQSPEQFLNRCYEHMSDMQCRFSSIRLISSNPARIIVHWRNSSVDIGYKWISRDGNGWGVWTDEYWTIYPDGVTVRYQVNHNSTDVRIHEMNQNEILLNPGQRPEDAIIDDALIVADEHGKSQTISRSEPSPVTGGPYNLQYINLKSVTKHFQIGEIGTKVSSNLHRDVFWHGWNHYPVQLIPSDGTIAFQYDRPASVCVATFNEFRNKLNNVHTEAISLIGLTEDVPSQLTPLNRSWNFAPLITDEKGCSDLGYLKNEKAYHIVKNGDNIRFKIAASKESPLVNPAFVIKNWESQGNGQIEIKANGKIISGRETVKTGIERDTDGKPMMVIWLEFSTDEPVTLEIISNFKTIKSDL